MTVCKPADHPAPLPERFTVSVIMQKGPSASAWSEANWEALGIAVTQNLDETNFHRPRKIHAEADLERGKDKRRSSMRRRDESIDPTVGSQPFLSR